MRPRRTTPTARRTAARCALAALAALAPSAPLGPARAAGPTADVAPEWLAAATVAASPADDHLPPWDAVGLPPWAQSLRVELADQPVLAAPDGDARRRGSAAREVHLPVFGARVGPGCRDAWLQVGAQAWVCGAAVELSPAAPLPARALPIAAGDGLPFRYSFVSGSGSFAYARLDEVDVGEPAMQLEPGFAVAVVDERVLGGETYGRTNRGLWVPMRDLYPASPLAFEGAVLEDPGAATLAVAWVVSERAPLYARTGPSFVVTGRSLPRFARIDVRATAQSLGGSYLEDANGGWLAARDVRQPTRAPAPPEVDAAGGERWLDVELATQTLVAYEGERAVFATLVSTGKGAEGSANATPKGTHRIWIKLFTSVMDNLEDEDAARYYRMEDVPYVQYFKKGVGLHAAYWHHSFGRVRSHGCVNLAPRDAARLFDFTLPRLPGGWTAVLPTPADRPTIVRVR
ncbi:MAG: L,D-transpeptidase [Myxococcales bacterium]|nr:L,D-transpeptidase [Myxococcales bacterium]